jgi:hypothetical protein
VADDARHPAADQTERLPVVFTAHAAETAYLREKICASVLRAGAIPVNPFMALGYFLYDLVPKDMVRRANNNLVMRCDELWIFGPPYSDGVHFEVDLARSLGMPIRSFTLDHYGDEIRERPAGTLFG